MFAVADSTAWSVLERLIPAKAKSDDVCAANLPVAKGVRMSAQADALRSRSRDRFPLYQSLGEKVARRSSVVTAPDGPPTALSSTPGVESA